jgi:hypothetical protein
MLAARIKNSLLCPGAIVLTVLLLQPVSAAEDFIGSVKLQNASVNDVSALLRKKYDWNVVLINEQDEVYKNPVITLNFNQVPVWVLVRYSCMASGLKYRFDDDTIIIGKDVEPAYRASDYKRKSKLDSIPFVTRMSIGTIYYLPVNYTPPQIVISNSGNTISYTSPMPIFRQAEDGISMSPPVQPPIVLQNERKKRPPEIIDELTGAPFPLMVSTLYDLKISVDLEQASLSEAFETIHKLSIQADPQKSGVNFFIKPFPGMNDIRIDIVLTNLSVHRVLKYVCESASLKYHAAPYVVVIYDPKAN